MQFSFDRFTLFTKVRRILEKKWNETKQNIYFVGELHLWEQWNKSKSFHLLNVYGAQQYIEYRIIIEDQKMFVFCMSSY